MDPALPRAIAALHQDLLRYHADGDAARLDAAIRQLAAAGRTAGATRPPLVRALCTIWEHVVGAHQRASPDTRGDPDVRFAGLVRLLLAEYERAGP